MRNIIFSFATFLCISIGLSSCLEDKGNYSEHNHIYAVVNHNSNENKTTLLTLNSELLVPNGAINSDYLEPGTCLYIDRAKIDYSNQPSKRYYTFNQISGITQIDKSELQTENEIVIGDYKLPIFDVTLNFQSIQKGIIFSRLVHENKNADYKMVYVPQENENARTIKNVYLMAKSTEETTSSVKKYKDIAFDINSLFAQSIDTAIDGKLHQYIKVNLLYLPKEPDETEEKIDWESSTFELNLLVQ